MRQHPIVLVDQREQLPLRFSDAVGVETVRLAVADYSLRGASDLVAIKRTCLNALATRCTADEGRLHAQLERLRSFPVRALVVECDLDAILCGLHASNASAISVLNTLTKASAEMQIPVWLAGNAQNAAVLVERTILWVATHLNDRPWSTPVVPDSPLAAEIRGVVAEEIRIAGMGATPSRVRPLPWSCDAEQELCALLLNGELAPEKLAPLGPQHFFASIFRNVFEAAAAVADRGDVVELDTIAAEFERRGMVGPFREELKQTCDATPLISRLQLRRRINEVMELSLRRSLIEVLRRCEHSLQTGEFDCDGARAALESFFFEAVG